MKSKLPKRPAPIVKRVKKGELVSELDNFAGMSSEELSKVPFKVLRNILRSSGRKLLDDEEKRDALETQLRALGFKTAPLKWFNNSQLKILLKRASSKKHGVEFIKYFNKVGKILNRDMDLLLADKKVLSDRKQIKIIMKKLQQVKKCILAMKKKVPCVIIKKTKRISPGSPRSRKSAFEKYVNKVKKRSLKNRVEEEEEKVFELNDEGLDEKAFETGAEEEDEKAFEVSDDEGVMEPGREEEEEEEEEEKRRMPRPVYMAPLRKRKEEDEDEKKDEDEKLDELNAQYEELMKKFQGQEEEQRQLDEHVAGLNRDIERLKRQA